jgi:hypothetical protein
LLGHHLDVAPTLVLLHGAFAAFEQLQDRQEYDDHLDPRLAIADYGAKGEALAAAREPATEIFDSLGKR